MPVSATSPKESISEHAPEIRTLACYLPLLHLATFIYVLSLQNNMPTLKYTGSPEFSITDPFKHPISD